jgi:hypothetical protein
MCLFCYTAICAAPGRVSVLAIREEDATGLKRLKNTELCWLSSSATSYMYRNNVMYSCVANIITRTYQSCSAGSLWCSKRRSLSLYCIIIFNISKNSILTTLCLYYKIRHSFWITAVLVKGNKDILILNIQWALLYCSCRDSRESTVDISSSKEYPGMVQDPDHNTSAWTCLCWVTTPDSVDTMQNQHKLAMSNHR